MRDDQTVAIAQHLWKIGRKPKNEDVSFPKIISARSGDAIRTELEWQERTTRRRIEFSEATPHRNPTAQQSLLACYPLASIQAMHIVRRKPMIRSWTFATIAAGLATCSSIDVFAADPLLTETFKILPAALAVEAAEAAIADRSRRACTGTGSCSAARRW